MSRPRRSAAEIGKQPGQPAGQCMGPVHRGGLQLVEGDLSNGKWRSGQSILLQPVMPIPITDDSSLITRPTLPVILSMTSPTGSRTGDGEASFSSTTAWGYALPLLYTRTPAQGSAGSSGTVPACSSPRTAGVGHGYLGGGSGRVVIYKTEALTAGLLAQYWWNYAGGRQRVQDTSHGSLLYFGFWNHRCPGRSVSTDHHLQ